MLDPAVPPLSTARLVLRRPNDGDVPAIQALADDWEVARWMARLPHPYRREDAVFFVEQVVPAEACWTITERGGGRLCGIVGLAALASPDEAELGYWLGRPHWGRGLATEAARAVLDHAFGSADLAAVRSGYFAGNTRSGHVLEKLGFRAWGTSQRLNVAQGSTVPRIDVMLERAWWRNAPPT